MTLPRSFRKMPFGERLRHVRERAGDSLSECAAELGITKGYVWEMERGTASNPTLKIVLAICRVYDISIQEMTEGL